MKNKFKNMKGITLISLVVTIVILLILAGVTILILTGQNGILNKSKIAKEEMNKQTATEILTLKITECQMKSIREKGEYPTLAYLAAFLQNDKKTIGDIDYVEMQSQNLASLDETPYTSWDKIYTKLAKYPYEFEINSNFQVAVNGKQVAIPTGYMKIPTETLDIIENGTGIDVKDYATVNVNVPNKIPDNYMETPTQENVKITQNAKNIDVTNYKSIDTTGLTGEGIYWKKITKTYPKNVSSINIGLGFVPTSLLAVSLFGNDGWQVWTISTDRG